MCIIALNNSLWHFQTVAAVLRVSKCTYMVQAARGMSLELLLPMSALRNVPCFTLGTGPNLAALQTCEQTYSLISVSSHRIADELNACSCTYARNTMCSEWLFVCVSVCITQLESHLTATVK